jgi:hypothetical protein
VCAVILCYSLSDVNVEFLDKINFCVLLQANPGGTEENHSQDSWFVGWNFNP